MDKPKASDENYKNLATDEEKVKFWSDWQTEQEALTSGRLPAILKLNKALEDIFKLPAGENKKERLSDLSNECRNQGLEKLFIPGLEARRERFKIEQDYCATDDDAMSDDNLLTALGVEYQQLNFKIRFAYQDGAFIPKPKGVPLLDENSRNYDEFLTAREEREKEREKEEKKEQDRLLSQKEYQEKLRKTLEEEFRNAKNALEPIQKELEELKSTKSRLEQEKPTDQTDFIAAMREQAIERELTKSLISVAAAKESDLNVLQNRLTSAKNFGSTPEIDRLFEKPGLISRLMQDLSWLPPQNDGNSAAVATSALNEMLRQFTEEKFATYKPSEKELSEWKKNASIWHRFKLPQTNKRQPEQQEPDDQTDPVYVAVRQQKIDREIADSLALVNAATDGSNLNVLRNRLRSAQDEGPNEKIDLLFEKPKVVAVIQDLSLLTTQDVPIAPGEEGPLKKALRKLVEEKFKTYEPSETELSEWKKNRLKEIESRIKVIERGDYGTDGRALLGPAKVKFDDAEQAAKTWRETKIHVDSLKTLTTDLFPLHKALAMLGTTTADQLEDLKQKCVPQIQARKDQINVIVRDGITINSIENARQWIERLEQLEDFEAVLQQINWPSPRDPRFTLNPELEQLTGRVREKLQKFQKNLRYSVGDTAANILLTVQAGKSSVGTQQQQRTFFYELLCRNELQSLLDAKGMAKEVKIPKFPLRIRSAALERKKISGQRSELYRTDELLRASAMPAIDVEALRTRREVKKALVNLVGSGLARNLDILPHDLSKTYTNQIGAWLTNQRSLLRDLELQRVASQGTPTFERIEKAIENKKEICQEQHEIRLNNLQRLSEELRQLATLVEKYDLLTRKELENTQLQHTNADRRQTALETTIGFNLVWKERLQKAWTETEERIKKIADNFNLSQGDFEVSQNDSRLFRHHQEEGLSCLWFTFLHGLGAKNERLLTEQFGLDLKEQAWNGFLIRQPNEAIEAFRRQMDHPSPNRITAKQLDDALDNSQFREAVGAFYGDQLGKISRWIKSHKADSQQHFDEQTDLESYSGTLMLEAQIEDLRNWMYFPANRVALQSVLKADLDHVMHEFAAVNVTKEPYLAALLDQDRDPNSALLVLQSQPGDFTYDPENPLSSVGHFTAIKSSPDGTAHEIDSLRREAREIVISKELQNKEVTVFLFNMPANDPLARYLRWNNEPAKRFANTLLQTTGHTIDLSQLEGMNITRENAPAEFLRVLDTFKAGIPALADMNIAPTSRITRYEIEQHWKADGDPGNFQLDRFQNNLSELSTARNVIVNLPIAPYCALVRWHQAEDNKAAGWFVHGDEEPKPLWDFFNALIASQKGLTNPNRFNDVQLLQITNLQQQATKLITGADWNNLKEKLKGKEPDIQIYSSDSPGNKNHVLQINSDGSALLSMAPGKDKKAKPSILLLTKKDVPEGLKEGDTFKPKSNTADVKNKRFRIF